jgi:hypothetical protein
MNVRHYSGGLTEWFETTNPANPANRPNRADHGNPPDRANRVNLTNLSTRFIDTLAERTVGDLFWMWTAIVAICGVAYWLMALTGVGSLSAHGLLTALYFSAVTATSVGYGDVVPTGAARVLILFGCVVSKFVSRRQEQLIGEIHRIAFEDRLGRVRTNLHLVRREVQDTARLCEGQDVAPPEALARVESAAMIFVGELHAVHDLLYRPQLAPDEAVLEAILAGLASVFGEFSTLLRCVQPQRAEYPPSLTTSLSTMSRLAREICGDCVPREFAPGLRIWMDQIQRIAGQLEQI